MTEYRVSPQDIHTDKTLNPDGTELTDAHNLWARLPKFGSEAEAAAYCREMVEQHPYVVYCILTTGPGGTAVEVGRIIDRRVFEEQVRASKRDRPGWFGRVRSRANRIFRVTMR